MWYQRYFENRLDSLLTEGKVFVLCGLRRVGKTSLIQKYLSNYQGRYFFGTGEDMPVADIFASQQVARISNSFAGYDLVVIDEAQFIPNIGLGLKLLVDSTPQIKVLASGSSSFELTNKLGEPLTGRQRVGMIYPMSLLEIADQFGPMEINQRLEEFMIFGTFPEVLTTKNEQDKIEYLVTLRDSYLLKDLLIFDTIRNSTKLHGILKLLAFQIGKEVSLSELGNALELSKQTIERYLDLLEKAFIIKKIGGFSRNLRKEVSKTSRYYFWDNGMRNALINNFNHFESRDDLGMLWENFMVIERLKRNSYKQHYCSTYFWRTHEPKEIDYIEEYGGELWGYDFKWGTKPAKIPKIWLDTYQNSHFKTVHRANFLEFVTI
jgi:hypothetical protein